MTTLDEQSDLGNQDQLPVGQVTGSAHLESKDDNIHKSELNSRESSEVKICSDYQVTHLQTAEKAIR